MKRAWRWLLDHWYIPFFVAGAVVGWLLTRESGKRGTPIEQTFAELDAIDAAAQVRKMEAEIGAAQAYDHVKDTYRAEMDALDEQQKAQAEGLRHDPAKLTKFLVLAGRSR